MYSKISKRMISAVTSEYPPVEIGAVKDNDGPNETTRRTINIKGRERRRTKGTAPETYATAPGISEGSCR